MVGGPHGRGRSSPGRAAARRIAVLVAASLAVAAGGAVLAPAPAAGQETDTTRIDTPYRWIPRGFRVGAAGGYLDAGLNTMDLGPQSTPAGGLRGRVRISSPISLEASALYGSSDRFAVDPRLEGGPAAVDTVTSRWILAEAAMQFALTGNRTWHGVQPFVLIGAGFLVGVDEEASPALSREEEASLRNDIEVMPAVQAGAGVEWLLGDRFGLSFEARDHLWRITTPDGFFDPTVLDRIRAADAPVPQETEWTHNFEFSLTLYRYF